MSALARRRILRILVPVVLLCSAAEGRSPGPEWFPGFPLRTAASVVLMWTPVPGATAYRVLSRTADAGFREIYRGQATTFSDTAAPQQVTILYKVVALVGSAETGFSPVATVPGVERLRPPVLTGAIPTVNAITLRWSPEPNTVFSKIYRAEAEAGPYRLRDSNRMNTYTDRDVAAGKVYFYRVSSVDKLNRESDNSVSACARLLSRAKGADEEETVVRKPVPAGEFYGEFPYRFNQPAAIRVSPKGELYVLNRDSVQILDANGKYLRRVRLDSGWGLAAGLARDGDGGLVIPFLAERVVRKIDEEGQAVSEIRYPPFRTDRPASSPPPGAAPSTDNRATLPNNPNDVAVDGAGRYWIVDGVRWQIVQTDNSGNALRILGRVPEFRGGPPPSASAEPAFPGLRRVYYNPHDGRLYAVLGLSATVFVIDPESGAVVRRFGGLGVKNRQFQSIGGLAFRSDGGVLVLDPVMRVIKEFDKELAYVATWADVVEGDRVRLSANLVTDIAYREDLRRIYLTSALGNRVYKYDLPR